MVLFQLFNALLKTHFIDNLNGFLAKDDWMAIFLPSCLLRSLLPIIFLLFIYLFLFYCQAHLPHLPPHTSFDLDLSYRSDFYFSYRRVRKIPTSGSRF